MNFYEHTIIARQDTSPAQLKQKSEIYWPAFLEEIQKLANSELKEASIEIELRIIQGQRSLYADHDLMSQVLLNLIRNAMESMLQNESNKLTLELDQGDGYHYLKVIDSGPAIEESMQDQIFLPFFIYQNIKRFWNS